MLIKKYFKFMLFLFLFVLLSNFSIAGEYEEKHKILLDSSKQINSQTPIMIDSETRLDTTAVIGLTITFKYTMVNAYSSEIDSNYFKNEVIKNQKSYQCYDDGAKLLMKNGVKYQFAYLDRIGQYITSFTIDRKTCGF